MPTSDYNMPYKLLLTCRKLKICTFFYFVLKAKSKSVRLNGHIL